MKSLILFLLSFSLASFTVSQQSTINISFSGTHNSVPVQLDSVYVVNITQGEDTTLYSSDTVLSMNYTTGIDELSSSPSYINLSPNYPNPFDSKTAFEVFLGISGELIINVFDIYGNKIISYESKVIAGKHQFSFTSGTKGIYILSVSFNDEKKSIKMSALSNNGNKPQIKYTGYSESRFERKLLSSINSFGFAIGDQLAFMGFYQSFIQSTIFGPTNDTIVEFNFDNSGNCPASFIDIRDNQIYTAVKIVTQCWMAKNLAYLPSVSSSDSGSALMKYYYVYDYQDTVVSAAKASNNYQVYGVLYNWIAAMDSSQSSSAVPSGVQGVCPQGWHIPSDEEWKILEGNVDSQYSYPDAEWDGSGWRGFDVGSNLKETGTSHWAPPNSNATNSSGFTALPGGGRGSFGSFADLGNSADFWTATENNTSTAIRRSLYYNATGSSRSTLDNKAAGRSVRCIKD